MQPSDNEDYNSLQYWNTRYASEEQYDWFASVYHDAVDAMFTCIERVFARQHRNGCAASTPVVEVLHLGIGNSNVCFDLLLKHQQHYAQQGTPPPYCVRQVAVDYSPVVIARMQRRWRAWLLEQHDTVAASLPLSSPVEWVVADVRNLSSVRERYSNGCGFDVVFDKGTMDALQTNDMRTQRDADVRQMLREVNACLATSVHPLVHERYRLFVQITWEPPHLRLSYTAPNNGSSNDDDDNEDDDGMCYAWGRSVTHYLLGDSDLYRVYIYEVQGCA